MMIRQTFRPIGRHAIVAAPAVALTAAIFIGGCASSQDKHRVRSTEHRPATVEVLNTVNDQVLWSRNVPPGQTLTYDFNAPGVTAEIFQNSDQWPTSMSWSISDSSGQVDSGTVELPGRPIMAKTDYRTTAKTQGPQTMPVGPAPGVSTKTGNSTQSNGSNQSKSKQSKGASANQPGNQSPPENAPRHNANSQNNNANAGQPNQPAQPANQPGPNTNAKPGTSTDGNTNNNGANANGGDNNTTNNNATNNNANAGQPLPGNEPASDASNDGG